MKKLPGSKDPKNLDIRMLRIFEVVAKKGSVSAAAVELQITQSAVSQAVSLIEQILGTEVLDRTKRPLKLTPAGMTLSRQARQIVHDVDRLITQVQEAGLANRPELRVGMIDTIAATVGPAIVKDISLSASQVLLWSGLAYSHAQSLLNRQLDLIMTSDSMDDVDGLSRRALFTEPFIVLMPKIRAEQYENATLKELSSGMPFIRYGARSHFGAAVERYLRRVGLHAPRYLELETSDVVMAMLGSDLGWTIATPLCVLQGRAHAANVTALPLPGRALTRTIFQISRAGEYPDTAERLYQVSRRCIETQVLPELRKYIPWLGTKAHLN